MPCVSLLNTVASLPGHHSRVIATCVMQQAFVCLWPVVSMLIFCPCTGVGTGWGRGPEVVDTGGLVADKSQDHITIWSRLWFEYKLAGLGVSPLALFVKEF